MKRNICRLVCLLCAVLTFSVTPAGVAVGGGGGGSCASCYSGGSGNFVFVFCVPPNDGDWGNTKCRVTCESYDDVGGCWCRETGDMCLYIVVNG